MSAYSTKRKENVMGEAKVNEENKRKAFESDPNMFVDVRDCLLVVLQKEGKVSGIVNNCQSVPDVFSAKGYADESLDARLMQIRVIQAQKKAQGIQVVGAMPPDLNGNHERKPLVVG